MSTSYIWGLTITHFIFALINYINSINLGIITFIYVYLKIEKNGKLLKIKENEKNVCRNEISQYIC